MQTRLFKTRTWPIIILLAVSFPATLGGVEPPSPVHPSGVLTLSNGNIFRGQMIGGQGNRIDWQSPHFATPFTFPVHQIQAVRLNRGDGQQPPRDPVRFITVGGNALTGTLRSLTDDQFQISSVRFGDYALRRTHVRQVRRIGVRSTLQDGPLAKHEWHTIGRNRSMAEWTESQGGQLRTDQVGAELFREFKFPDVAEVEIELQWQDKPAFVLAIAKPVNRRLPEDVLKVETWSEQLVLQSLAANGEFEKLIEFDQQQSIRLRMVLDQHTGELAVYSDQGELLGKLTLGKQPQGAGVYLKNKGADLTLVSLRVNSLDEPPGIDTQGLARFELRDGGRAFVKIDSYDQATDAFQVTDPDGSRRAIKLESMTGINFPATLSEPVENSLSIVCHDKSQVHGRLESVTGDRVAIRCAAADEPISLHLENVKEMRFSPGGVKAESGTFATQLGGVRHTGRPSPAGDPAQIGWKPAGSETASQFVAPTGRELQRIVDLDSDGPAAKEFRDIVYLRSGDVIPCRISQIDRESVHIETGFSQSHEIPCGDMRAVELDRDLVRPTAPFQQWQRHGKLSFDDDRVTFEGQSSLSHQDVLLGKVIEFDLQWHNNAYLMLTLFTSQEQPGPTSCPMLMIYKMNNQMHVRMQQPMQQMRNQALEAKGPQSRIRIVSGRSQIRVTVDDQEVINQQIANIDPLATGMTWQVQPLQVNVARGVGFQQPAKNEPKLLTVSNLHVGQSGMLSQLSVSDQLRRSLVTVPRSRRGNPSTHVLVARNGDFLRGRLEALSEDRVEFISRMDDVVIGRERLNGVIWLDGVEELVAKLKQDQQAPTTETTESAGAVPTDRQVTHSTALSVQATFATGARFTFDAERMINQHLEGSHRLLGPMRVPLSSLVALKLGPTGGPDRLAAFHGWKLEAAEEPKFAEASSADGELDEMFGKTSPLVGKGVSDINFKLLSGSTFRLQDHAEQVVILDFWATWCGPCIRELPRTVETVGSFAADDVVLIGVNHQENKSTIDEFLQARGWELQVGLDRDGTLADQFGVDAIPQTVIIGPGGKIERVYVGAHRRLQEELRSAIESLLKEG